MSSSEHLESKWHHHYITMRAFLARQSAKIRFARRFGAVLAEPDVGLKNCLTYDAGCGILLKDENAISFCHLTNRRQ
jgi:hypothetical protein